MTYLTIDIFFPLIKGIFYLKKNIKIRKRRRKQFFIHISSLFLFFSCVSVFVINRLSDSFYLHIQSGQFG